MAADIWSDWTFGYIDVMRCEVLGWGYGYAYYNGNGAGWYDPEWDNECHAVHQWGHGNGPCGHRDGNGHSADDGSGDRM